MADFSQLASTGLPSLGGGSDANPAWNRSLRELKIASDSIWAPSQRPAGTGAIAPSTFGDSLNTQIILGSTRRMPDVAKLNLSSDNNNQQASQRAENDFLNWEEAHRRRETEILKGVVEDAEATIRRRTKKCFEDHMQNAWERTRTTWLSELSGKRNLGGSAKESSPPLLADIGGSCTPRALGATGSNQAWARRNLASHPLDPRLVSSHLDVVRRIKPYQTQGNLNSLTNAAMELGQASKNFAPPGSNGACYDIPLRLVSQMLSRQSNSPLELALATLGLLSSQFDEFMLNEIRSGGLQRQGDSSAALVSVYKNQNANTVASYVGMQPVASQGTTLWPFVYYCLRIGDASAAKEMLESTAAENESDTTMTATSSVLSYLAQRQGSAASLWESHGPINVPSADMNTLAEACELAKATDPQSNLYRTGVLSLLGGTGPVSGSASGFSTIEDYIFGLLWKAVQHSSPVSELENAGKSMLELGANYFGDQDSGWAFALPLISTQQFRTALSFLVQAGGALGLLQGTHLAMLLSAGNVSLDNLGGSETQAPGVLVTELLVDYANLLQSNTQFGASCALEYMIWIPDKAVMMNEVANLILRADDIHQLAGILSADGKREKGVLDNYFPPEDVSLLMKQAGEKLFHQAKDQTSRTTAAMYFMLAGDFRSVLVLINKFIAPDTDVQNNAEKHFWYQQLESFFSAYLSKRTHVLEALERDDGMDVVQTSNVLMALYNYFMSMSRGAHGDAWSTLDKLDFIPTSKTDLSEKEMRFRKLDPLIKQTIPSVLLTAMHSLHLEYVRLKSDMHVGASGTAANALLERKERARVLLAFAGMIPSVSQMKIEEMSRMEASMV